MHQNRVELKKKRTQVVLLLSNVFWGTIQKFTQYYISFFQTSTLLKDPLACLNHERVDVLLCKGS